MLAVLHFDVAQLAGAAFHLAVQRGVGAGVVVHRHQGIAAACHDQGGFAAQVGTVQHFSNACAHRVALRLGGGAGGTQRGTGGQVFAAHQGVLAQGVVQTQVSCARGG